MTTYRSLEEAVSEPMEWYPELPETDAEVISASLRDPERFGEVFDRHWVAIHAFCCRRAGAEGEDIAAQTFRMAFDRRDRYDPFFPDARPWLLGIAMNGLRTHFRSTQRRQDAGPRILSTVRRAGTEPPVDELARTPLDPVLLAALARLSEDERDALLLFAWEGLGYAEIARAVDVPVGTIRSRIHRARRRMRVAITEKEHQ